MMIGFPFLLDLAKEDSNLVKHVIQRYFYRCLGSDEQTCATNYDGISCAYGVLSSTTAGKAYTHMYFGIDLAIRSGTVLYVLIEMDQYNGFVLLGARYTLRKRNIVYRPGSAENVKKLLSECSSHGSILMKIVEGFDGINYGEISSMRRLSILVNVGSLTQERKDEIVKLAPYLNFPQPVWSFNKSTVQRALELIADPTIVIPLDEPMHHSALFSRDRVYQVLSAFGYQAPILSIPGYPVFELKKSTVPAPLVMRLATLSSAVQNLKQILDTGIIRNGIKSKSNTFNERELKGNDATTIWTSIQKLRGVASSTVVESILAPITETSDPSGEF